MAHTPRPLICLLALAGLWAMSPPLQAAPPAPVAASAPASVPASAAVRPTLDNIAIPGAPRFVALAREVLKVQTAYTPDFASQSGLIDDALVLPSFTPARVQALSRRLDRVMAGLRALPWRRGSVDEQIDVRWMYANAERMRRELQVERLYTHRPGAWLETTANNYGAVLTYAPDRTADLARLSAGIPAMVDEMRRLCRPTAIDIEVTQGLIDGLVAVLGQLPGPEAVQASTALQGYAKTLEALPPAGAFAVVGARNYAWRLRRASLLPWGPDALLARAGQRLTEVDGRMAALRPRLAPEGPVPDEVKTTAATLDQAKLLALYDQIQVANRAAIERAGFLTIPAGVGPIRARVTPDAMVPLTGDGGSMNAPPPFLADETGWWNVEHFNPAWTAPQREDMVNEALQYRTTSMGPYAVHEGLPGHHLQLAIARLNRDPLRNLFQDAVQNEGWALYAEQLMQEAGGLGDSVEAQYHTLGSWRFRIRRVVYDVQVETGRWDLQQAADWKHDWAARGKPGHAPLDPDLQRTVNWPAQLICYFAGKEQILALKADYRKKMGAAYSERRFHDELLALGSVPYVFARAKMLGEAVPGF